MRKPDFCIFEKKGTDYCAADQRLPFRYKDRTVPLLPISEISSLQPIFCGCTVRFVSDLVANPKGCGSNVQALVKIYNIHYMSLVMRKPAFCICENKEADQLRGNREADQRLCFRYTDSTIPLLSKSEISSV